jgi:hypothetical protein
MGKYCHQTFFPKLPSISLHRFSIACRLGFLIVLAVGSTSNAIASTPGLPFTEDFSSQALMDGCGACSLFLIKIDLTSYQ